MMNMTDLIELLDREGYSCVIANGDDTRHFQQRGVADLHTLLRDEPSFLRGAMIADKVVGKGAAAIMIRGGIKQLYSHVISDGALQLFEVANSIEVEYGERVPHIINRDGSDWCPVEKLCRGVHNVDEILPLIDNFIQEMKRR